MAWWEGVDETRLLIAPDSEVANGGQLLSLRHPKSGNSASYLFVGKALQELHWFKPPYTSWFVGDYVCEDGRLYTATPIDPVFVLLPIFEEARMKKLKDPGKFRQLDEIIFVDGYPGYRYLLSIADKSMQVVCEIKEIGSTKFFRLDDTKVLTWLHYKARQIKETLVELDKNYAAQDEVETWAGAISILGEYLKDEPWLALLCNRLKINLPATTVEAHDMKVPPPVKSMGSDSATGKVGAKGTIKPGKQAKRAKVETDSKNIRDMFSRACRKGK